MLGEAGAYPRCKFNVGDDVYFVYFVGVQCLRLRSSSRNVKHLCVSCFMEIRVVTHSALDLGSVGTDFVRRVGCVLAPEDYFYCVDEVSKGSCFAVEMESPSL